MPIFSHAATLYARNGSSSETPTLQVEPADREGCRAWRVSTRLPLMFTADDGVEYELPPSFRDTTASPGVGTAYVVYSIKATAKLTPAFKRDAR